MSNELKPQELMLTATTLADLKENVARSMRENSFGDGMEYEMIYDGYTFVGLNNMPHVEIVQEYIHGISERDELLDQCLLELNADAMLKGIPMYDFDIADLEPATGEDADPQIRALKNLLATVGNDADYIEVYAVIEKRRKELNLPVELKLAKVELSDILGQAKMCSCNIKDLATVGCKCGGM